MLRSYLNGAYTLIKKSKIPQSAHGQLAVNIGEKKTKNTIQPCKQLCEAVFRHSRNHNPCLCSKMVLAVGCQGSPWFFSGCQVTN